MTLNNVIAVMLRYIANFNTFKTNYIKVVEVRCTLSATKL